MPGKKVKITYYCHLRKARFTRLALIDDSPELEAKLAHLTFKTLPCDHRGSTEQNVIIDAVRGEQAAKRGDSASIPGTLFGAEWRFARRKDLSKLWDWRKSAYYPPNIVMASAVDKLEAIINSIGA